MRPPRNEYKYLISIQQKNFLMEYWNTYLQKDSHSMDVGKTPILSLYYDSPGLDFYHEKLDGIKDRNKIRLRVYDYGFKEGSTCFLEIKQRFSDKVRKIRVFEENFRFELFDLKNWVFKKEIEDQYFNTLIETYHPKPTAQVFYIRNAFQALAEEDVRITFDTSLMGLHPDQDMSIDLISDPAYQLMPENYCILEIKNNSNSIPPWVFDGIHEAGLIQRSIPKYITAVEKLGIVSNRLSSGEYS